jgi:hypothetical protein
MRKMPDSREVLYTLLCRPEKPLTERDLLHSWNRIITPTTRRSSEKSIGISGNGQGVFRNQPLPKIIRKTVGYTTRCQRRGERKDPVIFKKLILITYM